MFNAVEVASLFGTLELRDTATNSLRQFDMGLERTAQNMQRVGAQITAFAAPITAMFGVATRQAMTFEASMANAGAVLGKTAAEMVNISDEILRKGMESAAGPQAAGAAYYEIVSGVTDATTHMAIFDQAIALSEAGQADLTATTSALISLMNSYNLSADKAGMVSDVLTRTVGLGVGSMGEFASALPNVTSLAATLGISFETVGTMAAFMTTKGQTASEAVTDLRGSMIALINPNKAMSDALAAIGASSGSAAIQTWGLAGTYQRLSAVMSQDELANAVGRVEALQAVLALTGDTFDGFAESFASGVTGATEAARAIQRESPAFQFALLQSKIQGVAITIGKILLPELNKLFDKLSPVIDQVLEWVKANPELIITVAGLAAAATVAGPALMGIGAALSVIGGLITFILSPLGLLVAGVVGLATFLNIDVVGGFKAVIDEVGVFFGRLSEFGGDIGKTLSSMFTIDEDGSSFFSTILEGFGMTRDAAQSLVDRVHGAFAEIYLYAQYYIGGIWNAVEPALSELRGWFVNELAPGLADTFTNHIMPLVQDFQDFLGELWNIVSPHLQDLYDWFVTDGLPAMLAFVTDTMIPGIGDFIDLIKNVWDVVSPGLLALADWFLNTALPPIVTFIQQDVLPVVEYFVGLLKNIWNSVSPALTQLYDWFKESLPTMGEYLQIVIDKLKELASFKDNNIISIFTGRAVLNYADQAGIGSVNQPPLLFQPKPFVSNGTADLGTGTRFNNAGTQFVAGMGGGGSSGIKPTASKPGVSVGAINIYVTGRDDDEHIKALVVDALVEMAG